MRAVLSWLLLLKRSKVPAGEFLPFISHLERVYQTRGLSGGIAYQKAVRTAIMNYLSGNPLKPRGVRCTTRGIPICLGPLGYRLVDQDLHFLQILTSILFSSRALATDPEPDTSTITAPLKKGSVELPTVFGSRF